MNKLQCILIFLFLSLISSCASFYQQLGLLTDKPVNFPHNPITPQLDKTKAFPSAKGYGAFSQGGRGGAVIYVSNLNDDGNGSLRDALQIAAGARNILLKVSGCIELKKNIIVINPYVTLAGQTAPGDGICLKGGGIVIKTHDVVIRHIRIRRGDHSGELGRLSDGIAFNRASNSIVDHVSVSWTLDELLQIWYLGTINNTVQNSIFSEPLNSPQLRPDEGHNHGYGPLIGNQSANFTFYRNVVTHSVRRNPRISNSQNIDILNNVFYKFRGAGTYIVDRHDKFQSRFIRVIDNIYKSVNKKSALLVRVDPKVSQIVMSGNRYMQMNGDLDNSESLTFEDSFESIVNKVPVETMSTSDLWSSFDSSVGASLPARDKVDSAILNSVRNGTGNFVNCVDKDDLQNSMMKSSTCKYESLIGEWPDYQSAPPPTDTDNDGMPDFWETANNLNIHSALDGPSFPNNSVYTNLELYLNELAGD
jgi:hypothetical protein